MINLFNDGFFKMVEMDGWICFYEEEEGGEEGGKEGGEEEGEEEEKKEGEKEGGEDEEEEDGINQAFVQDELVEGCCVTFHLPFSANWGTLNYLSLDLDLV